MDPSETGPMCWLAITPPEGEADAELLHLWRASRLPFARGGLLLRTPGTSWREVLDDPRLADVAALAEASGLLRFVAVAASVAPRADAVERLRAAKVGVHLKRGWGPLQVKGWLATGLPLGLSGHVGDPPLPAELGGRVRYTTFAPVFRPRTEVASDAGSDTPAAKPPVGLEALRSRAQRELAPLLALGGIDGDNAESALASGARGVASIRAFFGPPGDILNTGRALARALATHVSTTRTR